MKEQLEVGMTVFLQPLNNAARSSKEIQRHVVTKIGRKYFETSPEEDGGWYTQQFYLDTFYQNNKGYTSNWKVHLSEQTILDEQETDKLTSDIRRLFTGYGKLPLSLDQLRRIMAITEE